MARTDVGHGRGWLGPATAACLRRLDAARGRPMRTTSLGRTKKEQQDAVDKYNAGGPFALPVDKSQHQEENGANAIDFHSDEFAWLEEGAQDWTGRGSRAARHGLRRTNKSERWHYEYDPTQDEYLGQPAGEEEDMLNDDDKKWLEGWFDSVRKLLLVPGQPYGFPEATLNDVRTYGAGVVARTDAANTSLTAITGMLATLTKTADVDEAALAKALAPLITASLGKLSDADVQRIAKAAADEQAKRLKS